MVVDVEKLTDAELRTKLLEFGFPVMPITGTTRKVMAKKLKMLLENKDKTADGRRSLGRYSSEEESDSDVKLNKKRRATMGAPMHPPKARRSPRVPEPEPELPPVRRETRTSTATTRTQRIVKSAQDEFDTGSDSETDVLNNIRGSPVKSYVTPPQIPKYKPLDTSFSRNVSFKATSTSTPGARSSSFLAGETSASDYASEQLGRMRSRLRLGTTGYDYENDKFETTDESTPYLSNFTRRLSSLSAPKPDYDYKNDIIKEHDTNGSSSYIRSTLSSYRPTIRPRDPTPPYDNNIWKNNFVSFAVLAGTALFFIFLSIMYLGLGTDSTSVVTSDYIAPKCILKDPKSKEGVNCVPEHDIQNAIQLLSALRSELTKRAIAHQCHDRNIKAQMNELEIVTHCVSNFAIKDEAQIRRDLRNLQVLSFFNQEWGIKVVQTEDGNGMVFEEDAAKNMEQVVFNRGKKVTNLVIFSPPLPWRCYLVQTCRSLVSTIVFIAGALTLILLSKRAYIYYSNDQRKQKEELNLMVEKIIDILQLNANDEAAERFLPINHVRDMILPLSERSRKEKIWQQAVRFINENESRVRTEVQPVAGEMFEVWRWIGSLNLTSSGSPRNKTWQGQAFETQTGSVNSLPCSPTPCLKIRGMVEDGDRNTMMIRDAVLSKCGGQCRILHCAVETNSNCVYLKCADTNDAAVAYRNLHGWWYAGQLVTVKYLRLERYMQRFPESPSSGPPFLKAVSTAATNWAS